MSRNFFDIPVITNDDCDAGERMKLLREIEGEDDRPAKIAAMRAVSAEIRTEQQILERHFEFGDYEMDASITLVGIDFDCRVTYDHRTEDGESYTDLLSVELTRYAGPVPVDLPPGLFLPTDELDADTYDRLLECAISASEEE